MTSGKQSGKKRWIVGPSGIYSVGSVQCVLCKRNARALVVAALEHGFLLRILACLFGRLSALVVLAIRCCATLANLHKHLCNGVVH